MLLGSNGGFGMFNVMSVLFVAMFILVFVIIIVTLLKGLGQWNRNNHSPRLTVEAYVVGKRADVSHYRNHHEGHHHHHTSTAYYVTFEVASGDRIELQMSGSDYGLTIEGDYGDLTFQGTRFFSFDRKTPPTEE